jgi:hypothetical protein
VLYGLLVRAYLNGTASSEDLWILFRQALLIFEKLAETCVLRVFFPVSVFAWGQYCSALLASHFQGILKAFRARKSSINRYQFRQFKSLYCDYGTLFFDGEEGCVCLQIASVANDPRCAGKSLFL